MLAMTTSPLMSVPSRQVVMLAFPRVQVLDVTGPQSYRERFRTARPSHEERTSS